MKGSRWFVVGNVIFLLLMFALECRLPKKFVWEPTFSHYDKQPFGCAVFDSLLSASLPRGYSLSRETFYQMAQGDTTSCRGILAVADRRMLSDVDVDALLEMAERGNKIMLSSTWYNNKLHDTLRFREGYSYFNFQALKNYATSQQQRDSLCWIGDPAVYPRQKFYFYPQLCGSTFYLDSLALPVKILAVKECVVDAGYTQTEDEVYVPVQDTILNTPVAMSYPWGKGEVILVSTPLIFTNYGVLDGGNATYLFRLLSQMGELPIVRTEAYMNQAASKQVSPLRYFLSQRPLRWALYLSLLGILLFMLFTARRRQRAIPVVRPPANKTLEFVELIGTLYFQRKDHADLLRKKYLYFAEELRREIQVDIEEVADDAHSFRRIARKTGMDEEEITNFIRAVRPVVYGGFAVSDEQMKSYIDKMNEIISHI